MVHPPHPLSPSLSHPCILPQLTADETVLLFFCAEFGEAFSANHHGARQSPVKSLLSHLPAGGQRLRAYVAAFLDVVMMPGYNTRRHCLGSGRSGAINPAVMQMVSLSSSGCTTSSDRPSLIMAPSPPGITRRQLNSTPVQTNHAQGEFTHQWDCDWLVPSGFQRRMQFS